MAPVGKVERKLEVQISADDYYNLFKSQVYKLAHISSDIVQKVELQEGCQWHTNGGVKSWNVIHEGKAISAKERMEIDDASKSVTFNIIEGDMMKEFKSFKTTMQAVPKGDGEGCIANWCIEYEKLNENVPAPISYLDTVEKLTRDIEAHLVSNA